MRNKFIKLIACIGLIAPHVTAQTTVNTPGTGVKWTMDSLVAHYPAAVQFGNNEYHVRAKIIFSPTDTFTDYSDSYVNFDSAATFEFKKSIVQINSTGVSSWIAADSLKSFLRIRFDSAVAVTISGLSLVHSNGISFINSDATLDQLTMHVTHHSGSNPSGAISLLNSNLQIQHSGFHESQRSAISLSVNSGSSLILVSSIFRNNGTANGNYPQINIGTTNTNGVLIEGCTIEGSYPKVGGLAFLNVTPANYAATVRGNTFSKNRYGIAVNGRGIQAMIVNNIIDSNNIEGLPMQGGSGINILGDSSLNIIAANNQISRNLWGATIQKSGNNGSPKVSFGRIAPVSAADTGSNHFWGNGFNDTLYAIYNNTPDTVWAQRNRWDFETLDSIETTIFHHVDDANLGWVLFDSFYVAPPVDTGTSVRNVLPTGKFATVFPNPAAGKDAIVKSEKPMTAMRIFDSNGRLISEVKLKSAMEYTLPVSAFAAGAYFIWLTDGKQQQVLKWIIAHE
ncbi:MAG: T9SS type A sorting domain-containing protein [Sphingobacteriales bacterium]|nr:MAG: T9SS type A sorting domain-containing protein [Sphingobacteriales bacterium]